MKFNLARKLQAQAKKCKNIMARTIICSNFETPEFIFKYYEKNESSSCRNLKIFNNLENLIILYNLGNFESLTRVK